LALINQISNLRLLKYATAPRGKYSGYNPNPLIQEPIPFKFEGIDSNSIDFVYRGGDKTDQFISTDAKRFSRFLKTINGNLFVIKQHSLSRQGVPAAAGTIKSEPIREYSSNLTKKAIEGIGESIFYDGVGTNEDIPFENKYAYIYKNVPTEDNVLINLYNNKQAVDIAGDNEIISYQSGPGSDFGEGRTIISFINQRTGINNPLRSSNPTYFSKGGIKLHEPQETNINNSLSGVSKKEELKPIKTGFNVDGSQNKLFGPKDNNATPSKDDTIKKKLESQNNTLGLQMYETSPTSLTSSLGATNLIQSQVDPGFPSDSDLGTGLSDQGTTVTNFGFNTDPSTFKSVLTKLGKDYLAFRSSSPTNFSPRQITFSSTFSSFYKSLGFKFNSTLNGSENHSVISKEVDGSGFLSIKSNGKLNFYRPSEGNSTPPEIGRGLETSTVFTVTQLIDIDGAGAIKAYKGAPIYDLKDFRKNLIGFEKWEDAIVNTVISKSPSYSTKNREVRTKLGDPGRRNNRNVFDYSAAKNLSPLDKINASPPSIRRNKILDQDMVEFAFYALNNDKPTLNSSTVIQFRAFLNSFEDSYTSNWSDYKYTGRGDKFYSYGDTTRSVSLGFTLAAQSYAELKPMYNKLNYFISTIQPDYSYNGIKRGSLLRLTVGGYLVKQLGFLKGMKISYPEGSPWEIGLATNGGYNKKEQLPHVLEISGLEFQPIEEFLQRKWTTPQGNATSDGRWIGGGYNNANGKNYFA
jgi:hypothetical protein